MTVTVENIRLLSCFVLLLVFVYGCLGFCLALLFEEYGHDTVLLFEFYFLLHFVVLEHF